MISEVKTDQIIMFVSIFINLIVLFYYIIFKKLNIRIIDLIRRPFRERSKFILLILVTMQSFLFFLIFVIPGFLLFSYQIDSYPSGTSWDISESGEDSILDILQIDTFFGFLLVLSFLAIGVFVIWPVISAVIAKDRY